jgi:general secretion pathway protein G
MARRKRGARRGFTLMEVLLVLSILVILGGTVSFFFIRVQANANTDAAKTQISSYRTAVDLFRMDVGMYPQDQEGLEALRSAPSSLTNPQKWRGPYIQEELVADPWDMPYVYTKVDENTFQITSYGPDRVQGTEDDVALNK